ncbi:MAG: ATP-binding protein [Deltaproteobacteria bacterium]
MSASSHQTAAHLAAVSHELRGPLSGVASLATLLLDEGGLSARQTQLVRILERSAEDLVRLLDDRLTFERLEAQAVELEPRAFDLARKIDDLVTLLGAAFGSQRTALRVDYPDAVPRLFVTDPTRLGQVLTNLLTNALKFTPCGAVTIRVRYTPRLDDQGDLAIQVIDTGIGIPADRRNTLFEPFTQAEAATSRRYGGTGLGLAITGRVVDALGGTIDVDSRAGGGSLFTVRLPVQLADTPTLPTRDIAIDAQLGAGTRALVIDDDPLSLYVAEELLLAFGCEVFTADDVTRARALLDRQPVDLVFLDGHLPDACGYETGRELRARFGDALRIVALTGEREQEGRVRARDAGMDAHVPKPVTPETLEAVLTRFSVRARPPAASDAA